jgi:hypothetical protein
MKYLDEIGINKFIKTFNKKEDIIQISYNNQDIICYKVNNKKIDIKNKEKIKKSEVILSDKIRVLILLSIYHIKIIQNKDFIGKNNELGNFEEVFFIKKDFLEKYFFNIIRNNIIINKKIKDKI